MSASSADLLADAGGRIARREAEACARVCVREMRACALLRTSAHTSVSVHVFVRVRACVGINSHRSVALEV